MKEKDLPNYILGIVCIVAFVGIIMLILNTAGISTDMSGQAITPSKSGGLVIGGIFGFMILIILALYIYVALALIGIAKKTNTPDAWMAWVPFANIYLMIKIAKLQWWLIFVSFLPFIPLLISAVSFIIPVFGIVLSLVILPLASFICSALFIIIFCWIWWKIAEARGKPGWWGLIIILVPVINLILLGILAWSKEDSPQRPSSKLIQYYKTNLEKGYTKEQIKTACLNAGYSQQQINQALEEN